MCVQVPGGGQAEWDVAAGVFVCCTVRVCVSTVDCHWKVAHAVLVTASLQSQQYSMLSVSTKVCGVNHSGTGVGLVVRFKALSGVAETCATHNMCNKRPCSSSLL